MGSQWRQENYFRYARMHLDSHDAYATTDDDPTRQVPNPKAAETPQVPVAVRQDYWVDVERHTQVRVLAPVVEHPPCQVVSDCFGGAGSSAE